MRWLSTAVAAVTIAGVAWLGFAPTSVGLSNGVDPLECGAVFAPVEGASLIQNLSTQQQDAAEDWLVAVGYVDEGGSATADEMSAVVANVQALCGEAREQRTAWLTVTAVFGSALALAAWVRRPAAKTEPNTKAEAEGGPENG